MTPVFPLASSGDYSTVFFEAKYRILHDRFVSKTEGGTVFPPLEVLYDYQGRSILPPGIDRKKFRLLSESRQFDKFYDTVTELYGFTPTRNFTTSVVTAWTRPAFKCGLNATFTKSITDAILSEDNSATFTCENSDGRISENSFISIESGEYEDEEGNFRKQKAEGVLVLEADAEGFKTGEFEFQILDANGESKGTVLSYADGSALKLDGVSLVASVEGASSRAASLSQTDTNNQVQIVSVDNSDGTFKDGDNVKFQKAYFAWPGEQFYPQTSDFVRILKANADNIIVPIFYWNVVTTSGYSTRYESDDNRSGFFVPGSKFVSHAGEERLSWGADFAGTQIVDFVSEFDPQNAWAPESGREIVDYLSYYTNPTLQEYQEMISRGDMVLAQPQTYELLAGNVYKRTSVYVKCQ